MLLLPLLLLPGLIRAQESGMAIVGGNNNYQDDGPYTNITAEFWSPAPGDVYCTLPSLIRPGPNDMFAPTLNLWQDKLIVCGGASCDQLTPSGWRHWRQTRHFRDFHTSAITSRGLLLVGGYDSPSTTEFIPWDGGESIEGFKLYSPGMSDHCSITTSPDTIVLTGGSASTTASASAAEYSNVASDVPWEITRRELPPLLHARFQHACGSYTVGDTQMLLVTGGMDYTFALATTEVFAYNGAGAGSWREAGLLPNPEFGRRGLRAGLVNGIIHVVGGTQDPPMYPMNDIVSWDSVTETWTYVGTTMSRGRVDPGVTEVPMAVVADFC